MLFKRSATFEFQNDLSLSLSPPRANPPTTLALCVADRPPSPIAKRRGGGGSFGPQIRPIVPGEKLARSSISIDRAGGKTRWYLHCDKSRRGRDALDPT